MNHLTIYELYQAAFRSKTTSSNKSNRQVHDFILNLTNKELEFGEIELRDLPTDISKTAVKDFLDLVKDKIIHTKEGFTKSSTLRSQYYECHKLLFVAEILNTLLFRRAALFVAETLVKKSRKYMFLNISFQAYRIIYSVKRYMNDESGEVFACNEFRKFLKFYEIERNIEMDHYAIFRLGNKSKNFNPALVAECKSVLEKYEAYENIIPSFYFHYSYYNILYAKYINEKKHHKVYLTAKKAVEWFDALDFDYIPGKLLFLNIQVVYSIQNREFEEGAMLLSKAQSYISPRSQHWFRLKENEIILNFHRGDYNTAVIAFFDAINKKNFVSVTPKDKQRWILYEAYVNLVLETGNASYSDRKKRFSIQKFINDLPQFSKDKRSMNIPILIAQLLYFIIRKRYNHAIDRIEALDKYTSRYLRNDETFRSNCFIKMLLEIPKNSFNQIRVERAAQKYFERLIESDIDLIDQPFEIEIIPYERLWAIIMNHLRPDHHYVPKSPRTPQYI